MDVALLIPIFGILLVMIPVAGLTLGLTLRLAVKPFVETLADALRESKDPDELAAEVLTLRHQLETVTHELRELRSAQEFDRKLLANQSSAETRDP